MRLALTVGGLDLGLIVGLTAGLLSFIPYVGSITGGVTAIGLALAQFPLWRGVIVVAGVLVIGQILEGYVIYPRFLGDRVELPAVWVIFALFAGGAAFGFLGVMLAVPVAATIGVLCRFWLRRYLRQPALPRSARRLMPYDRLQLPLPFPHSPGYAARDFLPDALQPGGAGLAVPHRRLAGPAAGGVGAGRLRQVASAAHLGGRHAGGRAGRPDSARRWTSVPRSRRAGLG